ncbi:MAG: cyclic nucleotide-binding domain-containing protein [Actinomycetota bacterium]|nr:cyclic nucleotide-binding domain-containing protein [Actinomycetota bacterium]
MFTRSHRISRTRATTLRATPMFAHVSDAALARIDSSMVEIVVEAGSVLTTENDYRREAFIVVDGIAEVRVAGRAVSSVGPGDLVGEMALLDGGPRSATVVALTPLRVYVLDPRQFTELFADPASAAWIAAKLSQRLREVLVSVAPSPI